MTRAPDRAGTLVDGVKYPVIRRVRVVTGKKRCLSHSANSWSGAAMIRMGGARRPGAMRPASVGKDFVDLGLGFGGTLSVELR